MLTLCCGFRGQNGREELCVRIHDELVRGIEQPHPAELLSDVLARVVEAHNEEEEQAEAQRLEKDVGNLWHTYKKKDSGS